MRLLVVSTLLISLATVRAQDPKTIRKWDTSSDDGRSRVENWPECDEYKSADRCKVTIYLGAEPVNPDKAGPFLPRAHWDVHVKPFIFLNEQPRGEAAIVLKQSSPFLACTVSPNPGPATRDLSSNIGTLLTAVAALGAIPPAPAAKEATPPLAEAHIEEKALAPDELTVIENQLADIDDQLNGSDTPYGKYQDVMQNQWLYRFQYENDAVDAVTKLRNAAAAALIDPEPKFEKLERDLTQLRNRLGILAQTPPPRALAKLKI